MSQPPWADEKKVTNCAKCGTTFGVFTRKHHCRACGKVFCNICSSNSIQLPNLAKFYGNDAVRVCDTCFYKEKHEALVRAKKGRDNIPRAPDTPTSIQPELLHRTHSPVPSAPYIGELPSNPSKFGSLGPLPTPPSPSTNNTNPQPLAKNAQKGQSFASLPTSVRKDLQTKDVVTSIFSEDLYTPPPNNQNKSKSATNLNAPILNNVELQHPSQRNNQASINATNDIFGNINTTPKTPQSNNITPPIPDRSSRVLPTNIVQAPIATPFIPNSPAPTPPLPSTPSTHSPSPQSPADNKSTVNPPVSNILPPSQSPLSSPTLNPPTYDIPSAPKATLTFSQSVLSLPDPCVSVFIPPRDGGVPETPKTRSMQEKLFVRWINYYVTQRGIFIENLATEFSDGVIFIHLLECYTRIMLTDETKTYCTPIPASNDDKYMNFYSGLVHLAYLQKPMPTVNIQKLVAGDVTEMLNLLWSLLFRIEIEQKHLQGADGIVAILTWVKLVSEGFSNINIYDFKKSFEDGLVFNAIVSKHNPRLIDFYSLSPANKAQNVAIAFGAMYQMWSIPILLDVEDVIEDPDDVCIIIYLSQCYDLIR